MERRELSSEQQSQLRGSPAAYFPYVPEFPDGVTWYSIAVALYKMTGARRRKQAYERLYGMRHQGGDSGACTPDDAVTFEFRANVLGADHPVDIGNHSVEDVYARIVNSTEWSPWLGKRRPMAWCPQCMNDDLASHGWAAWHVIHQVPFVHDCPAHRTPLLTHCRCCGKFREDGNNWQLPSPVCEACGASDFDGHLVAPSEGYSALLGNIQAFGASGPYPFNEETWAMNMDSVAERGHATCRVDQEIRRLMAQRWNVQSVDDIPAILKVEERANWFAWAFDWKMPQSQLVRLLFYDALSSSGLWRDMS
jgi:hypothetical protein